MSTPLRIGIFNGSARPNSNCRGLSAWVHTHLSGILAMHHPAGTVSSGECLIAPQTGPFDRVLKVTLVAAEGVQFEVTDIDLMTYPLPLGPYTESYITQAVVGTPSPDGHLTYPYETQAIRDWSKIVQSLHAIAFVSPQYNWGMPGEVKNTIDHLFPEWVGLPVMTVNYGGRGGNWCADTFKLVFRGIKAEVVSCGEILIPLNSAEFIAGENRIIGNEAFLKEHEEKLLVELTKLVGAAEDRKAGKGAVSA